MVEVTKERRGQCRAGLRWTRRSGCGARWLFAWACIVTVMPAAAAEDEQETRQCLPSRGTDPATPPAVRLAGYYAIGSSGNAMDNLMAGSKALMSRYLPGAQDRTAGPARWLYDGAADAQAGRHELAQQHFTRCTAEAAAARDGILEAVCHNNLGAVAAARGRYAEARTSFERAAQQYRAELDRLPSEAEVRQRRAALEARMTARFEAAAAALKASAPNRGDRAPTASDLQALQALTQQHLGQALESTRDPESAEHMRHVLVRIGARTGTELVALNLGNVAHALGQWEEAQARLTQALAGYEGKLPCRPAALDDLLRLRERLPRKDDVTKLVERYRRAVKAAPDRAEGGFVELGVLALGGATSGALVTAPAPVVSAAPAAAPPRRPGAARREEEEPQTKLFADPMGATSEAGLQDLLARAVREERAGQAVQAGRSYGTLAQRAQAAGRTEVEATAQAALMRLEAAAGRPAAAIFHGKRAANLLQELRTGVAALQRGERRSYLREREQTYSRLAQLLMQSRRLVEAERVLQMLKEDEGRQFTGASSRTGYASLPETSQESAQRLRFEQASQALRRTDDERAAVGADRTYAMLLAFDLARIEQYRLRAGTELQSWLDRGGKGAAAEHEKALRKMPLEYQQQFAALFADRGRRLAAMLRALNEDAPQFRATPATPQQLAAIADNLRRADELRAALAPVLEAMRREPSMTAAQTMDRELDPATIARKGQEQAQRQLDQVMRLQISPEALAQRADLAQLGQAHAASVQKAIGPAMQVYMAAMTGREDRAMLAQVDDALKGASPEVLDGYMNFVRTQGRQMQAMQQTVAQAQQQTAPALSLQSLANRLGNLRKRGSDAASAEPARPSPAADPALMGRMQAELEAAGERARATAGPSIQETVQPLFGTMASSSPQERNDLEPPAMALLEPLARLWRIDHARQAQETRSAESVAAAAAQLESPQSPLPATADESLGALAASAVPTALLYYLPHDAGVDVLLVSAQGRQSWRLPVPRAELDKRIDSFGSALRDPAVDPRPAARALHDLLFAPVADAVQRTRAEVVALSLSGRLRFVPFAALHDGSGWLAERHAFAVHPGGRLADVLKPASGRWQVAAFGASKGGASLPPLQGVPLELDMIVQQGPRGALPGRQWLDAAFTAQALRAALAGGSQVVHIASHFKFEPGDAAQSFLLLGDGQRLSLQDLGGPAYRFDRTELVTLSACQTGVSGDDAFGQEVDGLAALLMAQGAPSVLASLWQVADGSTAQLMGTMYGLHAQRAQRPPSRAQALQQAQLAMIRGTAPPAPGGEDAARRGIERPQAGGASRAGRALGSAHPYHWAPFVLMGSWL